MSIHAQLTPEAAQRLRAQQRNSTIASIIISILAVVLVFVILAILVIKGITITQPDIVSYTASSTQEEVLETTEVNTSLQRKPSAPSSNIAKVIAANTRQTLVTATTLRQVGAAPVRTKAEALERFLLR